MKGNPMNIHDIRMLYAYNTWANGCILTAAAAVPADQFTTAALGACQLRDTLEHILVVESVWRLRWQGIAPETVAFPEELPTLTSLRDQWQTEDQQLQAYLATLSDSDLDRHVTYHSDEGGVVPHTLWQLLVHVVTHGTQHRSELALLLTALGHSPGALDFTVFVRATGGSAST
jgi:uncharacterized damage-inducible protein DinB